MTSDTYLSLCNIRILSMGFVGPVETEIAFWVGRGGSRYVLYQDAPPSNYSTHPTKRLSIEPDK